MPHSFTVKILGAECRNHGISPQLKYDLEEKCLDPQKQMASTMHMNCNKCAAVRKEHVNQVTITHTLQSASYDKMEWPSNASCPPTASERAMVP